MKLKELLKNIKTDAAVEAATKEWNRCKRRMGCVSATDWFCKRVPGFHPLRLTRKLPNGEIYQHVVATDGKRTFDLAKYADRPD
jgi:hypothetical protein